MMFAYSARTAAIVTAVVVAISGVAAPLVLAEDNTQDGTVEQLLACDGMTDSEERLTCINDLVESVKRSPVASSADAPSANAPSVGLPSASVSARPESKETKQDVEVIKATIVRSWRTTDGHFAVELDNGQVWRETAGTRVGQPKVGRSVEISNGRFGGSRMKIENMPSLAWVRRAE